VAFSAGSIRAIATSRRAVVIGGFSMFGFVVLGTLLSGLFGAARGVQLLVTLFVPAAAMVVFWLLARDRVLAREAEYRMAIELETVTNRASSEFLAGVSHELVPHPERCSLRAEALAVAVDYRNIRPDLKVAVPDVIVFTDPHLLRQILHALVGNAVRHGGDRVAIWATADGGVMKLMVSDDGAGLSPEIGDRVLAGSVDLAGAGWACRRVGSGLSLARTLSELIGAQISYKRDPNWTHFSIGLPVEVEHPRPTRQRVRVEAGVH